MPSKILRPLLAALAVLVALAAPAAAHAGRGGEPVTSGHFQDPSAGPEHYDPVPSSDPAPAPVPPPPAPAPAPQGDVLPEEAVGITRATPGDTIDVVASRTPARPRVSRRSFTIRIASGARPRSARVWVDGVPVPVRTRGAATTAHIDLRGRAAGTVVVRIRVRSAAGRLRETVRTYRTCRTRDGA